MRRPWGHEEPFEWAWVQIRNGLRERLVKPVPEVDIPGCVDGSVSSRRWFTWQQANAVSAFGVVFIREIVAALASEGIHPVRSWLTQVPVGATLGGKSYFFISLTELNGVQLTSKVAVPGNAVTTGLLAEVVLPKVCAPYPTGELHEAWRGNYLPGPYGSRVSLRHPPRPQNAPAVDGSTVDIVVTSATYYCRYLGAKWPGTVGSRTWPLDPAAERTPIVYDEDPATRLSADEVPAAAERTLAGVRDWGGFLGFGVGAPTPGRWRPAPGRSGEAGYHVYALTAPVEVSATPEQMWERARPYYPQVSVRREEQVSSGGTPELMSVSVHGGVRAVVTGPDAAGRFELRVEGPYFQGRQLR